jgi:hypothetical protein
MHISLILLFHIFSSTIVGLPTIKRDKYSVFNFLNFSTPTEQDQTERSSHQEQSHNLVKEQSEGVPSESRVEKELNKSKNMKSIFSHLVETENNIQKNTKPVSFSVKSTKSNKPKEFKSIFSHLEKEADSVKPHENIPVAMETESERKDGGQETKKDKNSDLLKKSSENVRFVLSISYLCFSEVPLAFVKYASFLLKGKLCLRSPYF